MRKLTSWGFRKCCSFRVLKVLNQSYWLSKSGENWRKKSIERRRQKKITRPQYRFLGPETNSMSFSHGWDDMLFVSGVKSQNCGRVIFFNASYFRGRSSFFGLIHLWRPITPVQNLTRPKSTTFSESSGRELSHGPSLDMCFLEKNFGEWAFYEKSRFLAFFHCRTEKKFKKFWFGQYWSLTPCP